MPHYSTDHNRFYNPFAMFAYAAHNTPHLFPRFDLFDDCFGKYDWSVEPTATFSHLMDTRAIMLRNKYERLVLYFSGGTDSITIYNTFTRLGLHLDEIVITYSDDDQGHPASNVQWLLNNHSDKATKITTYDRNTARPYDDIKDVSLVDSTFSWNLAPSGGMPYYRKLTNDTEGIIIGLEKPNVFNKNGEWFSTHVDKTFAQYLTPNNTYEWFFMSPDLPELYIKQCHMVKNAAKLAFPNRNDWSPSNESTKDPVNYLLYSTWCGRDMEVGSGVSFSQKQFLKSCKIDVIDFDKTSDIYTDKKYTNLLDGFRAFVSDKTTMDYMKRCKLLSNTSADYNGIYAQQYSLGK